MENFVIKNIVTVDNPFEWNKIESLIKNYKEFKILHINADSIFINFHFDQFDKAESLFFINVNISSDIIESDQINFLDQIKNGMHGLKKDLIIQFNLPLKRFIFSRDITMNNIVVHDLNEIGDLTMGDYEQAINYKQFNLDLIIKALKNKLIGNFILNDKNMPFLTDMRFGNATYPENQVLTYLLKTAIEHNNLLIVKLLLTKYSFDYSQIQSLIDTTWKTKNNELIITLLKADFGYPSSYSLNQVLKNFIDQRNNFHQMIKSGSFNEVKNYIENNSSRLFLNDKNESALLTSIRAKKPKIFAYLRSKRIKFRDDEEMNDCYSKLSDLEKKTFSLFEFYESSNYSHLHYLVSKSITLQTNFPEFEDKIKNYYVSLNNIPEISKILKVAQYAKNLVIAFDFESNDISGMDLKSKNLNGFYGYNNNILIAAKNENEIQGVLAHELTHLAMQLIFKNECKPYESHDSTQFDNLYNEAVRLLKEMHENGYVIDEIIQRLDHYAFNFQHAEMIVRVPHILGKYGILDGHLILNQQGFKNILAYFSNFLQSKCDEFISSKANNSEKIIELNHISGFEKLDRLNIQFETQNILIEKYFEKSREICIIKTKSTSLTIINIKHVLQNQPVLYFNLNCLLENLEEIVICLLKELSSYLVIECNHSINELFLEQVYIYFEDLLTKWPNLNVIFVIQNDKVSESLDKLFKNRLIDKDYSINDLKCETRANLLQKEINFQGKKIKLKEMIESFNNLTSTQFVASLIENQEIIIGKTLENCCPFYIERVLQYETDLTDKSLIGKVFAVKNCFKEDISRLVPSTIELIKYEEIKKFQNSSQNLIIIEYDSEIQLEDLNNFFEIEISCVLEAYNKRLTYISSYEFDYYKSLSEKEFISTKLSKLSLISDSAGTGKSTLIKSLSNKLKLSNENLWIIQISLNDCTVQFEKFRNETFDSNKIIDFLSTELLKHNNLEQTFFKNFFLEKKIYIFLDGYDEICPDYNMIVFNFIKCLIDNNIEICLTTRNTNRNDLEKEFKVKSFKIKEFSLEEQIKYLLNYWNNGERNLATNLINQLSKTVMNNMIGLPLHLKMLAEIFGNKSNSLAFNYNLLQIYEIFIEKKCENYFKEKIQADLTKVEVKNLFEIYKKDFVKNHQKLSLKFLLNESLFEKLFSEAKRNKTLKQEFLNTGIIENTADNQPKFIHQTFADYFCASFFVKNLHKKHIREVLVDNILIQNKYSLVRKFFENKFKESNESNELANDLIEKIKTSFNYSPSMNSSSGDDSVLINHPFSEKFDRDNLIETKYILHLSIKEGNKIFSKFLIDILKNNEIMQRLINLEFPFPSLNCLEMAGNFGHLDIAEYIIINANIDVNFKFYDSSSYLSSAYQNKKCKKNGLPELLIKLGADPNHQDENGNSISHHAATDNDVYFLKILEEKNANFMLLDKYNRLPIDCCFYSGYNPSHDAFTYLNTLLEGKIDLPRKLYMAVLNEDLEKLKNILDPLDNEERRNIINSYNENLFVHSSIASLSCVTGNLEIIKYLKEKGADLTHSSALENACSSNYYIFKNKKKRYDVIKYLIDEIKTDITFFAFSECFAFGNSEISLKLLGLLLNAPQSKPDIENSDGCTPLLYLINCNLDNEIIKMFLDYNADIFKEENLIGNSLHLAAERNNLEIIKLLMKKAYDSKKLDDLLKPSNGSICKGLNPIEVALNYNNEEAAKLINRYFENPSLLLQNDSDEEMDIDNNNNDDDDENNTDNDNGDEDDDDSEDGSDYKQGYSIKFLE